LVLTGGVDDRPHAVGLRRRQRDADAALVALREARLAAYVGPGVAAVGRLVDGGTGAGAAETPRVAAHLERGRVERVRVARIEHEVDGAGVLIAVQHLLPALAAVLGAEHAAIGIRTPAVAERRHPRDVGIGRVHLQAADLTR